MNHFDELKGLLRRPTDTLESCAIAAVSASLELNAGAILVLTTSGRSARAISKFRPSCPGTQRTLLDHFTWWRLTITVIMVTRNPTASRYSHLYRGVYRAYGPSLLATLDMLTPYSFPLQRGKARLQQHELASRCRQPPQVGHQKCDETRRSEPGREGCVRARMAWRHGTYEHDSHRACGGGSRAGGYLDLWAKGKAMVMTAKGSVRAGIACIRIDNWWDSRVLGKGRSLGRRTHRWLLN